MGISMVKALIRNYDDIEEWYPLTTAIRDLKDNDEKKIVDEICKDDFIEWMYLKIQEIIENKNNALVQNLQTMFSFLISFTDKSAYFCERITENESLLNFIKFIIYNENTREMLLHNAIYIVNNIQFQLEKLYFNDEDVKTFLIKQLPFDEKLMCVVTLMRISSLEEIELFENEIFTIIPDLIANCESCCKTPGMILSGVGLEEILKNIFVICKNEKVKDNLKENKSLIDTLNILHSNSIYHDYKSLANKILSLLGKNDVANELEQ